MADQLYAIISKLFHHVQDRHNDLHEQNKVEKIEKKRLKRKERKDRKNGSD